MLRCKKITFKAFKSHSALKGPVVNSTYFKCAYTLKFILAKSLNSISYIQYVNKNILVYVYIFSNFALFTKNLVKVAYENVGGILQQHFYVYLSNKKVL